jgi:hypothetical protein
VIRWDTEDWDTAIVIVGQCSSPSEAQWREITESLAKLGVHLKAQTVAKLAEIPGVVIEELRAAIEAERAQATRSEIANELVTVRASRQVDETNPNMLAVFGPNFSDCENRTPEQVRKLADEAVRDLRQQGKGNKPFHPQPDGIGAATKCALIVSIKLNWPGVRTRQAQAACQALYAAAGGDIKGTPNLTDGFWRDHLREARLRWRFTKDGKRDHPYSRIIKAALAP